MLSSVVKLARSQNGITLFSADIAQNCDEKCCEDNKWDKVLAGTGDSEVTEMGLFSLNVVKHIQ